MLSKKIMLLNTETKDILKVASSNKLVYKYIKIHLYHIII